MTAKPINYPPPWMDLATLCLHTCLSETTVKTWVIKGLLPPPVDRGGKLMWKWHEVDERLTAGPDTPESQAERVTNATRQRIAERRAGH